MSANEGSMASPDAVRRTAPATGPHAETNALLTPEQMRRWATLAAAGQTAFPMSLQAVQEEELRQEVKRLRRLRLVQFLARQIALALARDRRPEEENE
jgi:hypothetical protein